MPLVAWTIGTLVGLDDTALLGVLITATLPPDQNIFLHAIRYRVAGRSTLVTTVARFPWRSRPLSRSLSAARTGVARTG
jgi:predicted permease